LARDCEAFYQSERQANTFDIPSVGLVAPDATQQWLPLGLGETVRGVCFAVEIKAKQAENVRSWLVDPSRASFKAKFTCREGRAPVAPRRRARKERVERARRRDRRRTRGAVVVPPPSESMPTAYATRHDSEGLRPRPRASSLRRAAAVRMATSPVGRRRPPPRRCPSCMDPPPYIRR